MIILLKTCCYEVVVFKSICFIVGNKLTDLNQNIRNRSDCRELKDASFKKRLPYKQREISEILARYCDRHVFWTTRYKKSRTC
jgi:hypothetical protein